MKERVYEVVSQVMGVPVGEIDDQSSPDTIEAWDSLKHINLVLAIEETFGIQLSEEDIVEMMSVELVAHIVDSRMAQA